MFISSKYMQTIFLLNTSNTSSSPGHHRLSPRSLLQPFKRSLGFHSCSLQSSLYPRYQSSAQNINLPFIHSTSSTGTFLLLLKNARPRGNFSVEPHYENTIQMTPWFLLCETSCAWIWLIETEIIHGCYFLKDFICVCF